MGYVLIVFIPQSLVKVLAALFILLVATQLKFFPIKSVRHTHTSGHGHSSWHGRMGSVISGVFTGALAAPGPVALWTLLLHGVDALVARATLRYYFAVAYGIALALHWLLAGLGSEVFDTLKLLLPAMIMGSAIGLVFRHRISSATLMHLLHLILFATGLSLLIRGFVDVV